MAISIPFVRNKDEAASELKRLLRDTDIIVVSEDVLSHGVKLHAVYRDLSFALVLYYSQKTGTSSKVVLEKETEQIGQVVTSLLSGSTLSSEPALSNTALEELRGRTHIGIDESGKGDYFGPLVIAGVCLSPEVETHLLNTGVRDSKLLSDSQAVQMAEKIKSLLAAKSYDIVFISPEKYNELYGRIRNLNKLLAWGHARVLENLLGKNTCSLAVSDQFGDKIYINSALMKRGKAIKLIQTPKAEQDVAVASASILARDTFLQKLREMSEKYDIEFPKGATTVVEVAREFVDREGEEELRKVAKLHFKTTKKVIGGMQAC